MAVKPLGKGEKGRTLNFQHVKALAGEVLPSSVDSLPAVGAKKSSGKSSASNASAIQRDVDQNKTLLFAKATIKNFVKRQCKSGVTQVSESAANAINLAVSQLLVDIGALARSYAVRSKRKTVQKGDVIAAITANPALSAKYGVALITLGQA